MDPGQARQDRGESWLDTLTPAGVKEFARRLLAVIDETAVHDASAAELARRGRYCRGRRGGPCEAAGVVDDGGPAPSS